MTSGNQKIRVPLKLTFEEQRVLREVSDFGFKLSKRNNKSGEIKRYERRYDVEWYYAQAESGTLESIHCCLERLKPHLFTTSKYHLLCSSAPRPLLDHISEFRTFMALQEKTRSLLESPTQSRMITPTLPPLKRLETSDLWILTSLLFKRWPDELKIDLEEKYYWRRFLVRKVIEGLKESEFWTVVDCLVRTQSFVGSLEHKELLTGRRSAYRSHRHYTKP